MGNARNSESQKILNRKIAHSYFVGRRLEAGIVLCGTEVKSLREGNAVIEEAFVRLDRRGAPILFNAYIKDYSFGNVHNHDPLRQRKLLLKKTEINEIRGALEKNGESVLAAKLYFKHGLAKVELAFCKGKKLYDKRETLKQKVVKREAERALRRHYS